MQHKKALIAIAHGSRDPKWCQKCQKMVSQIKTQLGSDHIKLAYMEIESPTLLECVDEFVSNGFTSISVFPLFMFSGGHVDKDIPKQIDIVRTKHADIEISQLPPLGEHPTVLDAVVSVSKEALS